MVKSLRYSILQLVLFILLLGSGFLARHVSINQPERGFSVSNVEKAIQSVRQSMQAYVDEMPVASFISHEHLWQSLDSLKGTDFDLLVFQGYELVGWNNHLLPINGINPQYFKQALVRLENGWYLTASRQEGDILLVAFSPLKQEYLYQNKFLKNGFPEPFDLAPGVLISREPSDESVEINDAEGNYLFSFISASSHSRVSMMAPLSNLFLLLSLVVLWIWLYHFQQTFFRSRWGNLIWLFSSFIFALFFYGLIWEAGISGMGDCELFSPMHFAMSDFLPSIGHFLLFSFFLFTILFWFFKFFRLPPVFNHVGSSKVRHSVALGFFLLITTWYLIFINHLFYLLAEHSSGGLVLIRVIDLDIVIVARYFLVGFLLLSFLFLMERVCLMFLVHFKRWKIFAWMVLVAFLNGLLFGGVGIGDSDWAFLFFLAMGGLLVFSGRNLEHGLSYTTFLWVAAFFALYVGMVMMDMTIKKEESNRELLIENLSFQLMRDEDPMAEIYLAEIEKQLSNDVTLMRLLAQPEIDADIVRNHLVKFYFYGYWGRFDLQIIPCWPQGDLYIEDTQDVRNCYSYFFEMLDTYGYAISGSDHFHYLDNQNGRVSYFGIFRFFPNDPKRETSLFIELNSKPFFEGLGYPELLVSDRDRARMRLLEGYSHAKYLNGRLVKRSGDYHYKNESHFYQPVLNSKVFFKEGQYAHLVYQPEPNVTIVLSKQDYEVSDILMTFSLLFIFFFLFGALLILWMKWRSAGFSFNVSIQKRIQVVFVLLLLVLLIIVAIGTVYYTVQQFEKKHLELLENKAQSIMLELEYKIGLDGPVTSSPDDYLNYQLQMISNVFYSDINLYGVDGMLLGSSRPELFRNGLAGYQMNPRAYYNLAYTDAVRYLDEERIGELDYISFYVPLLDGDNRLSGFVNLPYFVGNNELRDEISSVIVTVVNFYLIFTFLVISIAVFLSRQITRPLLLLQSKISQIKLDRFNDKIDYKGEDEIGGLVAEYNRMVDELAVSAGKLAKTERELAWREMAKQIAHEIKNPLTPMKLNIQFLQRAWNDKVEDFDGYMNRVTGTLIEQINSLSSIASEFSKFAQMPTAKSEAVNIIDKIETSRTLFGDSGNVPIHLINHAGEHVMVRADGEQLLGVFNNLIKNAIQSIPAVRDGLVEIDVRRMDDKVVVGIKDNGKGVPDAIRDNLFVPSFTTKTGGMGLGLAISRRVIENAGGRIWFETEEGLGSVFYVELPSIPSESSSLT
ncbi:sensor histidine kinase [Geofilum rubicundum]|uniref:histidine kinase n=1 Tax=Geofilum rubicundum JCM 15548 TaxID=1236989 RepID=A0A0E9M1E3_9BACT|nr:ATP-binding protein [Geofilum rubicundum]GAO30965.1 hypothetical protein JCM15548_13290 [Geofilum rubicundum JCM 15548]